MIWEDQVSRFYNRSTEPWLRDDSEMYSTHNESNYIVVERFIRTLKSQIYNHMIAVSKNMYIDRLDKIVDKYNKTYHGVIKMQPADLEPGTQNDYGVQHNDKDFKFKVGDQVRTSTYKDIFAKEVLVTKEIKNTVPWTYVIRDLNNKDMAGIFHEKSCGRPAKQKPGLKN